jgi:pyruvate/2-oxoglutarate dehydrogenase complex dihydrolipoamide acyltransferase (E2) component
MRRCGRASCPFLVGLLTAAITAAGAIAAPGGNGKDHAGRGLALAKGHAKHAAATPQAPQAPAESAKPAPPEDEKNEYASPGVERRASHLTICHRTGSGRYIVISPSVTGATNGHLKHHDDFVYTGGCTTAAPVLPPTPTKGDGTPDAYSPSTPSDTPDVRTVANVRKAEELPFTGLPVWVTFLAGVVLIGFGAVLRFGLLDRSERAAG